MKKYPQQITVKIFIEKHYHETGGDTDKLWKLAAKIGINEKTFRARLSNYRAQHGLPVVKKAPKLYVRGSARVLDLEAGRLMREKEERGKMEESAVARVRSRCRYPGQTVSVAEVDDALNEVMSIAPHLSRKEWQDKLEKMKLLPPRWEIDEWSEKQSIG